MDSQADKKRYQRRRRRRRPRGAGRDNNYHQTSNFNSKEQSFSGRNNSNSTDTTDYSKNLHDYPPLPSSKYVKHTYAQKLPEHPEYKKSIVRVELERDKKVIYNLSQIGKKEMLMWPNFFDSPEIAGGCY